MDVADAAVIGRELLMTAMLLAGPIVIVSLVVGLLVSIAQTVTSIQEQTLTFAPRMIAIVLLMVFMMNWYLHTLQDYTSTLFVRMVDLASQ